MKSILLGALVVGLGLAGTSMASPQAEDPYFAACGGQSILDLENQPAQPDPATRAMVDRMLARLREGYDRCARGLARRHQQDRALGIAVPATPPASPGVSSHQVVDAQEASCSMLDRAGAPCVKKLQDLSSQGVSRAVFGNACAYPLEVRAFFADGSRGALTVKPASSAEMTCADCGRVQDFEVACP